MTLYAGNPNDVHCYEVGTDHHINCRVDPKLSLTRLPRPVTAAVRRADEPARSVRSDHDLTRAGTPMVPTATAQRSLRRSCGAACAGSGRRTTASASSPRSSTCCTSASDDTSLLNNTPRLELGGVDPQRRSVGPRPPAGRPRASASSRPVHPARSASSGGRGRPSSSSAAARSTRVRPSSIAGSGAVVGDGVGSMSMRVDPMPSQSATAPRNGDDRQDGHHGRGRGEGDDRQRGGDGDRRPATVATAGSVTSRSLMLASTSARRSSSRSIIEQLVSRHRHLASVSCRRSRSIARDRRDFTVPGGHPNTSAISASPICSKWRRPMINRSSRPQSVDGGDHGVPFDVGHDALGRICGHDRRARRGHRAARVPHVGRTSAARSCRCWQRRAGTSCETPVRGRSWCVPATRARRRPAPRHQRRSPFRARPWRLGARSTDGERPARQTPRRRLPRLAARVSAPARRSVALSLAVDSRPMRRSPPPSGPGRAFRRSPATGPLNAGEMNAAGVRIDSDTYSSALIPGRRSPAHSAASTSEGKEPPINAFESPAS